MPINDIIKEKLDALGSETVSGNKGSKVQWYLDVIVQEYTNILRKVLDHAADKKYIGIVTRVWLVKYMVNWSQIKILTI